jgi:hypothetical protein
MRKLTTLLASAAATIVFIMASPAHADVPTPEELSTPVVVKTIEGPLRAVSKAEVEAMLRAKNQTAGTQEIEAIAVSQCVSRSGTVWAENVFGGTLYSFYLKLSWCYNGSNVTWASHEASTSTGYGWYFDQWSNPPGWYYDLPYNTKATAYGQAKFCITWCAGSAYLGLQIVGRADGSSSVSGL